MRVQRGRSSQSTKVTAVPDCPARPVFGRKDRETQKSGKVTIGRVVYEGILRIEEVGAFRQMLVNGLGPSKAYGCGLMTLARPRE